MLDSLPRRIENETELLDRLSEPSPAAIEAIARLDGDLLLLGAAGKMGPTLARMARRAADAAGRNCRILAASRFSQPNVADELCAAGVEILRGDLLDRSFVASLPTVENVVFMTGMKFGASQDAPLTWAMNTYLPALVCERFAHSRIAAFSTGNVYGLVDAESGGSRETDAPRPDGEYAASALGRERTFEYFSQTRTTPVALLRLNYACELRYGVLVDIAQQVAAGDPIDVSMGWVNVIWQGDANAMTLAALADAASPAFVVNIAGPEMLRVRDVARRFGEMLGRPSRVVGQESSTALLNNGSKGLARYGGVRVPADALIEWIADWIARGGASLGKPTHFQVRDGRF